MILLVESIRKTNCISQGYQVGTIIIEENKPAYLEEDETRAEITLTANHIIEIYNYDKWEQITMEDLQRKTEEGWPLLAGFETRIKERDVKEMKIDEKKHLLKTVEQELEIETNKNAIDLIKKLSTKESTVGDIKKDLETIKPYEGHKNMPLFITAQKALEIIEKLTDDIRIETILEDV